MDMSSSRKELQGPRPAPLRVRKDSHKIKKPPVPVPPPPVIIYTVSPKIIHANPNEFMSLVQRLTGPAPSNPPVPAGSISPAARFASIERTRSPEGRKPAPVLDHQQNLGGIEIGADIQLLSGHFPGILSPNPNALPPIPPRFFSPSDYQMNHFPGFGLSPSPALHSTRNYYSHHHHTDNSNNNNNPFLPSPSSAAFISPIINMPSPNTLDLFHSLFDL